MANTLYAIVGGGGFGGAPDACASGVQPLYSSPISVWGGNNGNNGNNIGGVTTQSGCRSLPSYPSCTSYAPPEDNLQNLCSWSFDKGIHGTNGIVGGVVHSCQVACPAELYSMTGLHRADENDTALPVSCPANSILPTLTLFGTMMNCGKIKNDKNIG